MRTVARILIGFLASLVLAASVLTALVLLYTLSKEAIASNGDITEWSQRLRHYTDVMIMESNGGLRVNESSHPLGQMVALFLGSVALTFLSARVVRVVAFAPRTARSPDVSEDR